MAGFRWPCGNQRGSSSRSCVGPTARGRSTQEHEQSAVSAEMVDFLAAGPLVLHPISKRNDPTENSATLRQAQRGAFLRRIGKKFSDLFNVSLEVGVQSSSSTRSTIS